MMKTNLMKCTKIGAMLLTAQLLAILQPHTASAQGPLTNGVTTQGTISAVGQTDTWTFAATAGDAIIVRVGNIVNTGFTLGIQLLSPTSVLLGSSTGNPAAEIAMTATNTGTFTVRVSDNSGAQTNAYRVTLAKTGSP